MFDAIVYVTGLVLFGSAWILVGAWAVRAIVRAVPLAAGTQTRRKIAAFPAPASLASIRA